MPIRSIKYMSVIKCPICKYKKEEKMPADSCQILYECVECNATLKAKNEDCCVFCSYGSVPCPEVQRKGRH
ncbi:MAG: hypothetical protein JWO09_2715 [Bacteroidetes bacterium]|nr:hypothetical protein [Bacteroidota bacterium]